MFTMSLRFAIASTAFRGITITLDHFVQILLHFGMTEFLESFQNKVTVIILSFQTDRSGQTVQTQIRLLLGAV